MRFFVLLLMTSVSCVKASVDVKPIEGWSTQEGWTGSCFYPKNFDVLGPGDRRLARQKTLTGIMSQWSGERADGINFDADVVM